MRNALHSHINMVQWKSICLYKTVTCVKQRERKQRVWEAQQRGVLHGIIHLWECVISSTADKQSKQLWQDKWIWLTESLFFFLNELGAIFKTTFSPSLFSSCCFRGQGAICILMCLQKKYTLTDFSPSAFSRNRSLFSFHRCFYFYQYPLKHDDSQNVNSEMPLIVLSTHQILTSFFLL